MVLSPRKEQVRHTIMKSTVTSLSNAHQTLINSLHNGVVTQIPTHTVTKLNAIRTHKLQQVFSAAAEAPGAQLSQQQLQMQKDAGGNMASTDSNQQVDLTEGEDATLIPSLQALQNSQVIQQKVNRQYQELEETVHMSPGNLDILLETIQKKVSKENKQKIKWPQDLAFVGSLSKHPTYDQLTTCQRMLGFLRIWQEEKDPVVKENMVE